ncbi:CubicO group peptidase, beta-lactamase class C family [Hymenobacter daecheongensis DSM 21074]|uniref:CubicO group peptidase, beta-lactamase class C family n=1 Tax=Hymenobacter daecheongensis DSM 21074 TaxID=1121955 RepID=A0A1M6GYZ6_9BACT|nr:serine hydrolase domain-containing protein [Hymenobacter daecheongensis]SHJ15189.1 CubicO group peptidase, beta-lactamase class C family [Hymenobacter daecheongensis DSM 21074]
MRSFLLKSAGGLGGLLLALAQPAAAQTAATPNRFLTDSLDSYVQRGLRQWEVPGLAIVVVKNGKVVVSKGYGVRAVGKPEPVDANTLFMIASNTKLFTGTALAHLDEQKKISLDERASKYLPGFQLYDSAASRLVTVRDLMGHHFGFKTFQGDFSFFNSNLSREDIIYRMRLMKPGGQFRREYGYCNSGFVAAGQVIPAATGGTSWEEYVRQNILRPLGMSSTSMNSQGFEQQPNHALAYSNTFGPLAPVPFDNWDNMGPCASMTSNVTDLAKWLQFQLDSGRYQGQRVLPWSVLRKTRDANTVLSARKSPVLPTHFTTYGLGVLSTDYNGKQVFWHTGGASGQVSNVCFVPEEGLGIAILTNNDNQSFFEALRYQILDSYLGVPYADRSAFFLKRAKAARLVDNPTKKLDARVSKKAKLPMKPEAYTGNFENALFGSIIIAPKNKQQLLVRFPTHPGLTATLDYMDGNEFRCTYSNLVFGVQPAVFKVEGGKVTSVQLQANDYVEQDPYVFSRR